jgi:hypothetical protein
MPDRGKPRVAERRAEAEPRMQAEPVTPAEAIEEALGQTLREALDLSRWDDRPGLQALIERVAPAVRRSVDVERKIHAAVRRRILAELKSLPDAPAGAGVFGVDEQHLRAARRNILLAGRLTAADAASTGHDGVAATLVAVGICLTRYDGAMHSWRNTFLRHDYRADRGDEVERLRYVLDRRAGRGTLEHADQISGLLRRGITAAVERKALLQRARTMWRLGHGVPAPLEVLTGSGSMELIDEMLPVLEQLLLTEKRWVFVPERDASRALLTIVGALEPGQLAILQKGKLILEDMVREGTYDPARKAKVLAFADRLGEAMVVGGFRATPLAPGQLFLAHVEHAHEAGVIAMADAALQPHRGYPLLLELARLGAKTGLGVESFGSVVEAAYAKERAAGLYSSGTLFSPL